MKRLQTQDGLITFGTLFASSHGLLADKGEETYEHGGRTWVIHQDELPLVVEDLMDVDYDGYIKERRDNMSLLLGQMVMHQRPRLDADNYVDIPQLEYTLYYSSGPCTLQYVQRTSDI